MNERWGMPATAGRQRDWPQTIVLPIALSGTLGSVHTAVDAQAERHRMRDTLQELVTIQFEGDGELGILFVSTQAIF
jgi:hypothetical protein